MTKEQAKILAQQELMKFQRSPDAEVILAGDPIERKNCWVFFYNSRRFLETGENKYRLAGNRPIFVNKQNGTTMRFGSGGKPVRMIIEEYESKYD
jgi:hypothetical protein